jgi:hypothetical protein
MVYVIDVLLTAAEAVGVRRFVGRIQPRTKVWHVAGDWSGRDTMSTPYVIRITPADVGRRVSVRSRLPAEPGEPTTTDTVGRLIAWEAGVLRITRRDGTTATVNADDLLAGKVIGETPPRRPRSTLPEDPSVEGP